MSNNQEYNSKYIGKYILIGLTYLNHSKEVDYMVEVHGVITEITNNIIYIKTKEETPFTIPFDLRAIRLANPGTYKLRSTGEEIKNPDYLSTWTITPPEKKSGE